MVAELPNLQELAVAGQKTSFPGFPALTKISVWRTRLLEEKQLHPLRLVTTPRLTSERKQALGDAVRAGLAQSE